jgi:hypothetical protein
MHSNDFRFLLRARGGLLNLCGFGAIRGLGVIS